MSFWVHIPRASALWLADTIEYGQWKLGSRNESVIFSLNPFITKLASAIQAGIFAFTLAVSGLNQYSNQISELEKSTALSSEQIKEQANALVASIPDRATILLRVSMIALPLLLILASYLVYRKFYRIDDTMYSKIIEELETRAKEESQP